MVPDTVVTNEGLSRIMDTDDDWISSRSDALISSNRANTVLVVGAEVHAGSSPWGARNPDGSLLPADGAQRELNNRHRRWSVPFEDGAGAMIVRRGADPSSGVIASQLFTDGTQFDLIAVPGLGFRNQPYADLDQIDRDLHWPVTDGGGLYRQARSSIGSPVANHVLPGFG